MPARSESEELRRLASLAGKVFRVPVAYAAMLGHHDRVMTRIGSGSRYWKYMRTLPLVQGLASPMLTRDGKEGLPENADLGGLSFMASAPILTLCQYRLGVLVIADKVPRPEFSERDQATLVDLAGVIACSIELRMLALQSTESQLRYDEAEERFRRMANSAQTLIACNESDGSCTFVNDAWLKFTGRYMQRELGDGWQQLIHQQHRERVMNLYWEALQTRQSFRVEVPLCRHDGVFRWMQGGGTPRFLKDSSFTGFIVCLTEVPTFEDRAPPM